MAKLTCKEKDFGVVDEVFEESVFHRFWAYFNNSNYAYRNMNGWQKVWRINDGQVLAGESFYHTKAPFKNEMDWVYQAILSLAKTQFADIVGEEGKDWDEIHLTPYLYPAGTKISWHDDYGYSGACIFYPHLHWDAHWGGELMVARTPPEAPSTQGDNFTRPQFSNLLNQFGMGVYLAPLPNRMVFTKGGAWHGISRVDSAAGDHMRCSVVAFFQKSR